MLGRQSYDVDESLIIFPQLQSYGGIISSEQKNIIFERVYKCRI